MSEKIDFSTRRVMAIVMALLISIAPATTTIVAYAEDETTPVIEEHSDLTKSEDKAVPHDTEKTLEESKSEVKEITEDKKVSEESEEKDVTKDESVNTDTEKEDAVKTEEKEKTTVDESKAEDTIKPEEIKPFMATALLNSEEEKSTAEKDFAFADGVIKEYKGSDTDVVIPKTIGGIAVTTIDSQAFSSYSIDTSITSILIPKSVTTIKDCAFFACDALTSVRFEGECPTIEAGAFGDVYNATFYCHVDYKDAFETALDDYLGFSYGGSLETFGKPSTPEEPKPVDPDADFSFEAVGEDGYVINKYKGEGGDVVIPDTYEGKPIVAIGEKAFDPDGKGFSKITSITMPDTVKTIGDWAFNECIKMETIKLSSNLEAIGENAFQRCDSLTEINVPETVTEIKDLAFTMCEKLKNINVADGNANYKDIDGILFDKDGKVLINYPAGRTAKEYNIPEGTELVHADAFKLYYGNKTSALTNVTFPSTLKEIGDRAFMQTKLESITIVPGIKMGEYVFDQCKNAKTAVVQEGVTKLESGMLYALESCETVKLPSTLKEIGYRAFDRLAATNIELPEGLEVIGEEAFECSKLTSITIPASVKTIGPRAFYLSKNLKEVNFSKDSVIKSIGAYAFNQCKGLETVNLPNSLTTLEDGAFSHCYSLKSIKLPNSLTTLENVVFAGSVIENITLPDSIKNIGNGTFRDCSELETVKMPAYLETLGTCTFEYCHKLTTATFPETIKLSYLPQDTFFDCRIIEHIYLPSPIKETKACAFSNCKKNPVIEHADKNLKRSLFDCFSIDLGEYSDYYEVIDSEKGIYKLTSDIPEKNETGFEKLKQLTKESEGENGSIVKSRSASGKESLCGCGGSANAIFAPTCAPTFKYKPATSGEATIPSTSSSSHKSRSHSYGNSTNGVTQPVTVAENNAAVPQTEIATPPVIINAKEKVATQNINPNIAPKVAQSPELQVITESNKVNNTDKIPVTPEPSIATSSTNSESSAVPLAISVAVGVSAIGAGGCAYALKIRKRKLHLIGCNE